MFEYIQHQIEKCILILKGRIPSINVLFILHKLIYYIILIFS